VGGPEAGNRRPNKVRQPETPLAVVQCTKELREQYTAWRRERLRVLLEREGVRILTKRIDRVIARLKARND
jgi:hypothetical protein